MGNAYQQEISRSLKLPIQFKRCLTLLENEEKCLLKSQCNAISHHTPPFTNLTFSCLFLFGDCIHIIGLIKLHNS